MKQLRTALAALVCAATFAAVPAVAQIGTKPIRLVVAFAPGGGLELVARTFNNELGTGLGQPVIVENRPGAGGMVGASSVAKAAPDGQTLFVSGASYMVTSLVNAKPQPPYDPIKDFSFIAHIATGGQVLLVGTQLPTRTLSEFIAHVKANPGKFNYGSAGNGSSTHLVMAYFLSVAGLDVQHIPFRSNAEQITDLLGGRIQAVFLPSASAMPYAKDERIRLLAVTSREHSRLLPNLPTVGESYPGFQYESWFVLLGPAGIPKPIIDRVNAEMAKLLKEQAVRERIEKLGIEPLAMSPDAVAKLLQADYERLVKIVKLSGAAPE